MRSLKGEYKIIDSCMCELTLKGETLLPQSSVFQVQLILLSTFTSHIPALTTKKQVVNQEGVVT